MEAKTFYIHTDIALVIFIYSFFSKIKLGK